MLYYNWRHAIILIDEWNDSKTAISYENQATRGKNRILYNKMYAMNRQV